MGFGPSEWVVGRDGEPRASGLRLLPRDMLKIGQLALAGGTWNGKPIVPAARMTHHLAVIEIRRGRSYGYHWYIGEVLTGVPERPLHLGGRHRDGAASNCSPFPRSTSSWRMNCMATTASRAWNRAASSAPSSPDVVLPNFV